MLTVQTAKCTLYPPIKRCINPDCDAWRNNTLLKKEEQRQVVVFTHADGARPAWAVHLKCRGKLFHAPSCLVHLLTATCHSLSHELPQ